MNDILDLPGWTVLAKRLDGTEYELEAEYTVQPTVCPKCGSLGKPYKHGTKNTTYRDSPIRGKTTRILARVQRYRCRDCSETFLQPLAGVLANRLMTERCAEFIGEQCLVDTFVRIAQNVGCDEKTVRTLASECIARLLETHKPALPAWLGIDETTIDGCLSLRSQPRRHLPVLWRGVRQGTGPAPHASAGARRARQVHARVQALPLPFPHGRGQNESRSHLIGSTRESGEPFFAPASSALQTKFSFRLT
jgi:transposase-like protein